MGENNVLGIIKNVVKDMVDGRSQLGLVSTQPPPPSSSPLQPPSGPDDGDGTGGGNGDDGGDDGGGSSGGGGFGAAPVYVWSPPDIPPIQIAPFQLLDLAAPTGLALVSQEIKLSSDGGTVVNVVVSCLDVTNGAEYEFRISSD